MMEVPEQIRLSSVLVVLIWREAAAGEGCKGVCNPESDRGPDRQGWGRPEVGEAALLPLPTLPHLSGTLGT